MNHFAFMRNCNPVWQQGTRPEPYMQDKLRCNGCDEVMSIQQFHRDSRSSNGRQQPCKRCRRG